MSNLKSELSTFMEQNTLNLKYYKHSFLRICEPYEIVILSTEKEHTDKRRRVQPFLVRMHILSSAKQTGGGPCKQRAQKKFRKLINGEGTGCHKA